MATYTPYQEIVNYANTIPCRRTQRAILRIADELSEGTFENKIQGVAMTSTAAELNKLDGFTGSTAEMNVLGNITSTAAEINKLDGVAVTATEMDQRTFSVKIEDVSVAKSVYAAVPWAGSITTIYAVGNGTNSQLAPDVYSFGGNGIAMSGNIITVTTGATVGVSWGNVSPTSAQAFTAGQIFRASTNGFSTGASQHVVFSVLMDIT